jgi:glycosyltransferase involved in cell wall biosynthesis
MNKGLQFATGDYVWFINAGDQIPDPEILRKVMSSNKSIDIIYGDTMIIDEEDNKLGLRRLRPPAKLNWKSFGMGMVVCHQAILVKRKLAEEYDLTYSIAADYDWVLRALKKSKNIVNTNIILIMYLAGGFSRHNVFPSLLERFTIMVKNYGLFRTIVYHFKITLRLFGYLYKRIIK